MTTIAVCQFSVGDDPEKNLQNVRRHARVAADRGAALLVAPEYSMFTVAALDQRIVDHAEPADGPWVQGIRRTAMETGLAIVVGFNESIAGERRVHNTLVFVDGTGDVVGAYRKVHLYDAFGVMESDWILPGDPGQTTTAVVDGLTFAAQTCYDIRFPEVSRVLVVAGADLIVVPAQWVPGPLKEDHWSTLLRARAIENTVYVAAADQCHPHGSGQSMIVDPMGVIVAALGERSGVALATVDSARTSAVRAKNPSLSARRFEVRARRTGGHVPADGSCELCSTSSRSRLPDKRQGIVGGAALVR